MSIKNLPLLDLDTAQRILEGSYNHPTLRELELLAQEEVTQTISEKSAAVRSHVGECLQCNKYFQMLKTVVDKRKEP